MALKYAHLPIKEYMFFRSVKLGSMELIQLIMSFLRIFPRGLPVRAGVSRVGTERAKKIIFNNGVFWGKLGYEDRLEFLLQ